MKRIWTALAAILVLLISCDTAFQSLANGRDNPYLVIVGEEGGVVVKFDKNGGDEEAKPNSLTVWSPAKSTGALPEKPVREGYTFSGWNTKADGSGASFTANTSVTVDITVYAKWSKNSYTVKYNINGAKGTPPEPQTTEAGYGITFPDGGGLTKTGYTFGGWNTQSDGSGTTYSPNASYTVSGNVTFYAVWNPVGTNVYTVMFDSTGGSEVANQAVISGEKAARPDDPLRAYHSFSGWYTDSSLAAVYDFNSSVNTDITLYAGWERLQYTVAYDLNGGEGTVPDGKTVNGGDSLVLPQGTGLSKAEHDFGGWNTRADGLGINFKSGSSFVPSSNLALYVKWNPAGTTTHTVTFDSGGGSNIPAQTVVSGNSAFHPSSPPVRDKYTFAAWYADPAYAAEYNFSTPVTGDITVYAKWNNIRYTVTFDANRGSGAVPPAEIVDADLPLAIPGAGGLARTGYTFGGWNTNSTGSGTNYTSGNSFEPIRNITLFAVWKPVTYTVRYDKNAADTAGTMDNSTFTYDLEQNLSENNFTRAGHVFGGWTDDEGKNYADKAAVKNLASSQGVIVILRAVWNVNKYTVTFNSGGGSAVPVQTVEHGAAAVKPANPKRTHYTFDNWYGDSTLSSVYDFSSPVTGSRTIYAKWNVNRYSVTYDVNGGTGTGPAPVTENALTEITLPNGGGLARTGYTFGGWNTRADGTGTNYSAGASYRFTDNAVLYAKWIPAGTVFTVTFNSNGGSSVAKQSIPYGIPTSRPNAPARTNYTFDNWYSDSGLSTLYDFSNPVTRNITIYAKWNPNQYTVSFSANGGSGTVPPRTAAYASAITLPAGGALSRDGYTFDGWNTNTSGTGTNYAPGVSFRVNGNTTLYAKWKVVVVTYTVNFNINGGSGSPPAARTVNSGASINLPSGSGFSKSGFVFGGWNTREDGTGTNYNAGASYKVSGSATFYANWIARYTVTFNINSGTGTSPADRTVNTDTGISLPGNSGFTRTGYTFYGWNTRADGTGTPYSANSSYTVTGNITLYAKWVHTVTFDTNGGSFADQPLTSRIVEHNAALTITVPNPVKSGYTFALWYTEDGNVFDFASAVTENFTLYALWE